MKRFISILLVLIMLVSIYACGHGLNPQEGAGTEASASGGAAAQETPESTDAATHTKTGPDPAESGTQVVENMTQPPDNETQTPENETQTPDNETQTPESGDPAACESEPGNARDDAGTPPVFGLIDAHADTISRALLPKHKAGLYSNNLHVDFKRLYEFGAPVQVFVAWCSDSYVADAYNRTNLMLDFFEAEVAKHSDIIEIALTLDDMERNARNNKISAILAIEGGEALMGNIDNLGHFYDRGVRIMTLTWNRENELGYGQAVGSDNGLKPFGEEVVRKMEELGIIMDLSHINEAGFWDAHRLSTRPYIASHSNSYAVAPHKRNLTDDQIVAITRSGGIIGLALYPLMLSNTNRATKADIMAHIEHFIDIGAGDNLGLGCDLDGFDTMPKGFSDVSSLKGFAADIADRFDELTSAKIMSGNFYDFFVRYFRG